MAASVAVVVVVLFAVGAAREGCVVGAPELIRTRGTNKNIARKKI
jgi:hypothetical protein